MTQKLYRLGAIAFIVNKTKRLLIVQLNSYSKDEWTMPGGGRKHGESVTQNITRELWEELGIKESELQLVGVSRNLLLYNFPSKMIQKREPIALNYTGQKKNQIVFKTNMERNLEIDKKELRKYMWCPISDLEKYLIFPGQYKNAMAILAEFKIIQKENFSMS